jgi:hypothetical protein
MPIVIVKGADSTGGPNSTRRGDIVAVLPANTHPGKKVKSPQFFAIIIPQGHYQSLRHRWKRRKNPAPFKNRFALDIDAIPSPVLQGRHSFNGLDFLVVGPDVTFRGTTYASNGTWLQLRSVIRDKVTDVNEASAGYNLEVDTTSPIDLPPPPPPDDPV